MNDLLNDEKSRMEGDFQDKNQKNNKTIASLRSENEGLTLKTSELEYQVTEPSEAERLVRRSRVDLMTRVC
jgi:hypothetical protein